MKAGAWVPRCLSISFPPVSTVTLQSQQVRTTELGTSCGSHLPRAPASGGWQGRHLLVLAGARSPRGGGLCRRHQRPVQVKAACRSSDAGKAHPSPEARLPPARGEAMAPKSQSAQADYNKRNEVKIKENTATQPSAFIPKELTSGTLSDRGRTTGLHLGNSSAYYLHYTLLSDKRVTWHRMLPFTCGRTRRSAPGLRPLEESGVPGPALVAESGSRALWTCASWGASFHTCPVC